MDISRLDRNRTIVGAVASLVLLVSLLFLPWYSLADNPTRASGEGFVCGAGDFECTGIETFPILGPLLVLAALAPPILGYIVARGHRLSWPPGEVTMVVGFTAFVLIAYNGLIDRPGSGLEESGVGLDYGYYVALAATAGIAAVGYLRAAESGGRRERRAPGTV